MHRSVDSTWTETCVTDDWASGATTAAANVPGARPACRDVPQGADVPSHPHRVGRTVAGGMCHHSRRIGEVTKQLCEVDSRGQPAGKPFVERLVLVQRFVLNTPDLMFLCICTH